MATVTRYSDSGSYTFIIHIRAHAYISWILIQYPNQRGHPSTSTAFTEPYKMHEKIAAGKNEQQPPSHNGSFKIYSAI